MATDGNKEADKGDCAVMPGLLLGRVTEYMGELRGRIIAAAYQTAGKRGSKKRPCRVTSEDVLKNARPLLASAFRELEQRLQELTPNDVRRRAS